jgi:hypothetical protein
MSDKLLTIVEAAAALDEAAAAALDEELQIVFLLSPLLQGRGSRPASDDLSSASKISKVMPHLYFILSIRHHITITCHRRHRRHNCFASTNHLASSHTSSNIILVRDIWKLSLVCDNLESLVVCSYRTLPYTICSLSGLNVPLESFLSFERKALGDSP